MIISCPTCSTRYTLDDASMGAHGRKVRCAKCSHVWWQTPATDTPPADDEDLVTEIRPSRPVKPARSAKKPPARRDRRALIGWGALALILAALGTGGVLGRGWIVAVWPPAALLYDTVGLPVEPAGTGLAFQGVRSEQLQENGAAVIHVEGQILNASDLVRAVPGVRVILRGSGPEPLGDQTIQAEPGELPPGAIAIFRHTLPAPEGVTEVTVTFVGG
nr:zinc-ribbon domain-containing protein [Azospirillum sp. SYSU D00513]